MTRPICVFVLFGFFAQIIPPRGMAICDVYKYTNPDLSGIFPLAGRPSSSKRIHFPRDNTTLPPPLHPPSPSCHSLWSIFLPLAAQLLPYPIRHDFPPPPQFLWSLFNFGFDFGADFSRFDDSGDNLSGLYEYDGVSCGFSVEGYVAGQRRRHQR